MHRAQLWWARAVFIKVRRRKHGNHVYEYLDIVENQKVQGKVVRHVLGTLGRRDQTTPAGGALSEPARGYDHRGASSRLLFSHLTTHGLRSIQGISSSAWELLQRGV